MDTTCNPQSRTPFRARGTGFETSELRQRWRVSCIASALCAAETCEVPLCVLFDRTRGRGDVSFARQLAMYLAHVELGIAMARIGDVFGRDRTTVAHACRRIEDARDCPEMDARIVAADRRLRSVLAASAATDMTRTSDIETGPRP